jgi:hypothetical protein
MDRKRYAYLTGSERKRRHPGKGAERRHDRGYGGEPPHGDGIPFDCARCGTIKANRIAGDDDEASGRAKLHDCYLALIPRIPIKCVNRKAVTSKKNFKKKKSHSPYLLKDRIQ